MIRFSAFLLGVVSVLLVTGCDDSHKPPSLVKVSGKVTLDGQPMSGGEVRFNVAGEPVKSLPVNDGAFAGEIYVGQSTVEVIWEVDGPPHPMDPTQRIKVNSVDPKFSGPNSPFKKEIPAGGATDLSFEVTSAKK